MVTRTALVEPAVARRLLSYELTRMCTRAGVTHASMGARLGVSRASFSQLVAGKNLPSRAVLEVLAHHLHAMDRLPMLLELLGCARSRPDTGTTDGDRELLIGLEVYADTIEVYDPLVISPLLRTDSYARTLADDPARGRVLTADNPPALVWVVEEHALTRVVGDAALMRQQYDHLRGLVDLPNVTVHVLPADLRAHHGLGGGFEIVHGSGGSVACEFTRQAAHYLDRPEVVAEYAQVFSSLRELALSAEKSRVMLLGL